MKETQTTGQTTTSASSSNTSYPSPSPSPSLSSSSSSSSVVVEDRIPLRALLSPARSRRPRSRLTADKHNNNNTINIKIFNNSKGGYTSSSSSSSRSETINNFRGRRAQRSPPPFLNSDDGLVGNPSCSITTSLSSTTASSPTCSSPDFLAPIRPKPRPRSHSESRMADVAYDCYLSKSCVYYLHHPSVFNLCRLRKKLGGSDRRWMEDFLENEGMQLLFECLGQLSRQGCGFQVLVMRLECVLCIRTCANSRIGLECLILSGSYAPKFALGG